MRYFIHSLLKGSIIAEMLASVEGEDLSQSFQMFRLGSHLFEGSIMEHCYLILLGSKLSLLVYLLLVDAHILLQLLYQVSNNIFLLRILELSKLVKFLVLVHCPLQVFPYEVKLVERCVK
jgi:hypothetical protein